MPDEKTGTTKKGDDENGESKPLTPDQNHKNYLADVKRLQEEHGDPSKPVG